MMRFVAGVIVGVVAGLTLSVLGWIIVVLAVIGIVSLSVNEGDDR